MTLARDVIDLLSYVFNEDPCGIEITEELMEALNELEFLEYIEQSGPLYERAMSTSTGDQPWAHIPGLPTANTPIEEIRDWVQKHVMPFVNKSSSEFSRKITKVTQFAKSAKAMVSVKTTESIKSKILRGKGLARMHDILRAAILVKEQDDVAKIREAMRKTFKLFEEDEKEFGKDKEYGYYGAVHYLVEVGDKMLAEVQVMTKELWTAKVAAHSIYTKERDKIAKNKEYTATTDFKSQQKISRDLFRRGAQSKKGIRVAHGPNMRFGKDGDDDPGHK